MADLTQFDSVLQEVRGDSLPPSALARLERIHQSPEHPKYKSRVARWVALGYRPEDARLYAAGELPTNLDMWPQMLKVRVKTLRSLRVSKKEAMRIAAEEALHGWIPNKWHLSQRGVVFEHRTVDGVKVLMPLEADNA